MKTAAHNQYAYDLVQELLGGRDTLSGGLEALSDENMELARSVYDALCDRLAAVDGDFMEALNRLGDVINHPEDAALAKNNLGKALRALNEKTPTGY